MTERKYTVADTSGKWSPPITEGQLFEYARKGYIGPATVIREDGSGSKFFARDYPALAIYLKPVGASSGRPGSTVRLAQSVTIPPAVQTPSSPNRMKRIGGIVGTVLGVGAIIILGTAWFGPGGPTKADALQMSERFVRSGLKSPMTATFNDTDEFTVTKVGKNTFDTSGTVDSQNGFGALIRSRWEVEVKYTGDGNWHRNMISIDGDTYGERQPEETPEQSERDTQAMNSMPLDDSGQSDTNVNSPNVTYVPHVAPPRVSRQYFAPSAPSAPLPYVPQGSVFDDGPRQRVRLPNQIPVVVGSPPANRLGGGIGGGGIGQH